MQHNMLNIQVRHKSSYRAFPCVHFCTVPLRREQNLLFLSPSDQIRCTEAIGRRETGLRGCCDLSSASAIKVGDELIPQQAARRRARKRAAKSESNVL